MRVVEVVYDWPAETFIQRHVVAMQSFGFPVFVVARHAPVAFHERASLGNLDESLHAEVMPNFNHMGWAGKWASLRFLTRKSILKQGVISPSEKILLGYFEGLHPDIIHFHDSSLAASMRWIPHKMGIPYTLSLRGSDVQVLPLRSQAQREATLSAIKNAAKVHAVCYALGRSAVEMAGNVMDFSVIYTTLPIPPALPPWQGVPAGEQAHFISSGRLMWRKGYPDLLVALRHLRERGLDARLTIIGAGPELDHLLYLRKMLDLESVVDFPGKLTYEQIRSLYGHAHAYIQSSVAEGLSNSLAEAMANGLPVFATDIDGTSEVIEEGISGFLLPPLAPHDWVEKLILVYDTALMEQVRFAAFDKARQFFSADRHANAFASFFEEEIIKQKRIE